MAYKLFFTLPEEKRLKILSAAKQEFSNYSFEKASINNIIKMAGISRGGFYLYFKDKTDIYFETIKYQQQHLKNDYKNQLTIDNIENLPLLMFDFYVELKSSDKKFAKQIFKDMNPKNQNYFKKQVTSSKNNFIENLFKEKYSDKNTREAIKEILFGLTASSLVDVIVKNKKPEQVREILLIKIELLQKGIGGKNGNT